MYSQNNEEEAILKALASIEAGRFLDIGAFHPTIFSNTRALFERGWCGVMLEPSPGPFSSLKAAYGEDPRIKLLNVAVGEQTGEVEMYVTDDAVSTTSEAQYQKWCRAAAFSGKIRVPAISVPDLISSCGDVDFEFASIDAEGQSVDILGALLAEIHPKCVCVEYDDREEEARRLLWKHGYEVALKTTENLVGVS